MEKRPGKSIHVVKAVDMVSSEKGVRLEQTRNAGRNAY